MGSLVRYLKHKKIWSGDGEFDWAYPLFCEFSEVPGKHFLRFFRNFGEVMTQKDIG
jgi:hypothetical protein